MKRMSNNRSANYDLLKAVCVIAVIMIHVSSAWVAYFTESVSVNQNVIDYLCHPLISCIYNSVSRFAVPCFLMISGAFLLSNEKNIDYHFFYTKKVLNTIKVTGFFTLIYILYRFVLMTLGYGNDSYISILLDVFKGAPMYHMWYLYMLIILYLAVPVVIRFKKSISFNNYKRVSYLFFLIAIVSRWTVGNVTLNWDIGQAFEFLSFFMIGDVIKAESKKNNVNGIAMIVIGFSIEVLTAYLEYYVQIVHGVKESDLAFRIVDAYTPTIAIASLFIFWGFSKIQVKSSEYVNVIVKKSLLIYLIHAGVLDFIKQSSKWILDGKSITYFDCLWAVPVVVVITLMFSLLLSYAYSLCRSILIKVRINKVICK